MHIHLDPVGGVAGDMFAAALLDAFPERADALAAGLADSRLHEIVTVESEPFTDGILTGRRFHTAPAPGSGSGFGSGHEAGHAHHPGSAGGPGPNRGRGGEGEPEPEPVHHRGHEPDHRSHPDPEVTEEGGGGGSASDDASGRHERAHQHEHGRGDGHRHDHPHHSFADIRAWLRVSGLASPVAARADAIFTVLAQAEAQVHGIAVEDVTFHEVGAWDSIADVVCAAWLIDSLEPATWSCASLPLGGGRVRTAHGLLPVPAPATALLLRGYPSHHDGVEGERVTPTGAAIVRHLDPAFDRTGIEGRIARTGHGFGNRRLPGVSNVLRALVLEPAREADAWREETIAVCSFEVDDQTAEDLAVGLDRLRATEGVLDIVQTPTFGKKGRVATSVRLLARPAARERVLARCFAETTTLGVRWQTMRRAALDRMSATTAGAAGDAVRIKRSRRPGGEVTVKAEMDDLARADGGRREREERRRKAEST